MRSNGNNPGGTRYTGYGFEVRKNGVLIASRETKGPFPVFTVQLLICRVAGEASLWSLSIFIKAMVGRQYHRLYGDCDQKAASGISIR